MGQLSSANEKIGSLVDDLIEEQTAEIPIEPNTEEKKDKLMQIAGVLDGWDVKADEIDDVEFFEDDDMKRTREARNRRRKW